ncbi:MAG TPA: DUF2846 domain-containing protein, partial [Cellvibrionaceae bacterium]
MKTVTIILILLLSACTTGPHFSEVSAPGDNEALVFLFRERGHSIMNVTFTFEDTKVVSLGNDEYSWITVRPGEYPVKASEPMTRPLSMSIDAEAGEVYYVGYSIERKNGGAMITLRT